jgi:hypothetical protein
MMRGRYCCQCDEEEEEEDDDDDDDYESNDEDEDEDEDDDDDNGDGGNKEAHPDTKHGFCFPGDQSSEQLAAHNLKKKKEGRRMNEDKDGESWKHQFESQETVRGRSFSEKKNTSLRKKRNASTQEGEDVISGRGEFGREWK